MPISPLPLTRALLSILGRRQVLCRCTALGIQLLLLPALCRAAVFPGATWATRTSAEAGLDRTKLDQFRDYLGGDGCVVRHGFMVYTWGDVAKRQDIASACKPWIAHFMWVAFEKGYIASLDARVADWQPCLASCNPQLDHKDREITFRHLMTQTSCYGVSERPGTAYDYNDFQMALLFDTMLKVYGQTIETADDDLLHERLTDLLQFEDNPTFRAFGDQRTGRVRVSVRDVARFGLLYLHKGKWDNRYILSQTRALEAVRSPLPNSIPRTRGKAAHMCRGQRSIGSERIPDDQTDHLGSYSYCWWTNGVDRAGKRNWPDAPLDVYGAFGHTNGKRAVVVFPSLDMVVAWNDTTIDKKSDENPQNEAFKRLMAAVQQGPAEDQIVVDRKHPAFLKRQSGGPVYICGPGDPEDFLYRGRRNSDGTRSGDQMALIEKLAPTGANCIYVEAIRSHGGDGDASQSPFVDSDVRKELDEDILQQWETWFTAMDDSNIVVFFILYDDDATPFGRELPAGGNLDAGEARFIAALVSRFKHHRRLIWCVAEEYREGFTREHASRIAAYIRQVDDRRHPIAIHQNDGTDFDFSGDASFDQFAVQYNVGEPEALHRAALAARDRTHGRLNINMAEFSDAKRGDPATAGSGEILRRRNWAIAMAGAHAMDIGMDIASTPLSDLYDCGRLVRFMQETAFDQTAPHNELACAGTQYVLADPGSIYLAYAANGASLGLKLESNSYSARWYDVVTGTWVDEGIHTSPGGEQTFLKPAGVGAEAALYLKAVPSGASPGANGCSDQAAHALHQDQ